MSDMEIIEFFASGLDCFEQCDINTLSIRAHTSSTFVPDIHFLNSIKEQTNENFTIFNSRVTTGLVLTFELNDFA